MKKLFEGNIKRNFFFYALPLVLTVIFSQAYSIINTIMAGNLIGDEAISAIGSTKPFIALIESVFWGYGTGFSIYVALLFGKNDYKKMLNVIKVNVLFCSLVLILVALLCIIFHVQIFDFLKIEDSLRKDSFDYFGMYMAGMVLTNLTRIGIYVSNAIGVTTMPFIASILTNVINIAGNYIFIKFCNMGIMGTALATNLSSLAVTLLYLVMFSRIFKRLGLKLGGLYFDTSEIKFSLSFAFPNTLQQSVMYFCTAITSPLTNLCGQAAISGYTVGMQLYDLNSGIYQNSNKTVSNYIAQCIGAQKHREINRGIRIGLVQTVLFLVPFLAFTVLGAGPISEIFLDSEESIRFAEIFMLYCMPFIFFNLINNFLHAVFRSVGAGIYLVISTIIYSISRIAYSYLLFDRYEMYGIYAAIILSWITEAIFGLIVYFSGKWKSAEYRRHENLVS